MSPLNLVLLRQTVFEIFEGLISNERKLAYPNSGKRIGVSLKNPTHWHLSAGRREEARVVPRVSWLRFVARRRSSTVIVVVVTAIS